MTRSLFCVLVLSLPAVAAEAPDAPALLRRGVALAREASFAASVAALEQARARGPLSPSEIADCGYWLATDYLALGSTQAARRELRALLAAAPLYELPPYTSPKVAALYREVREEVESAPRLKALPPRQNDSALMLYFEASRTQGTAYGAVYWRWRGERHWREAGMQHLDDSLLARVTVARGGTMEYWAEIRAPGGAATAGSREKPLELAVTAPPAEAPVAVKRDSIATKWWLWTTLGVVSATGLGVGLYFALRPTSNDSADAVLDFQVR
jgi:hypothetical protein